MAVWETSRRSLCQVHYFLTLTRSLLFHLTQLRSLACPRCHRDDFANQQGFLNHCRLAHGLEFGPYEEMIKQCGTPVDESEVPLDHPIRLRAITKPLSFNRYILLSPCISMCGKNLTKIQY